MNTLLKSLAQANDYVLKSLNVYLVLGNEYVVKSLNAYLALGNEYAVKSLFKRESSSR